MALMKLLASHLTGDAHPKVEWIRLPRPGSRCPYTGLSRSTLMELCIPREGTAPVKSAVIRKPGAIRGIRLVHYASLLAHLDGLVGCSTSTPKVGKAKPVQQ